MRDLTHPVAARRLRANKQLRLVRLLGAGGLPTPWLTLR